MKKTVGILAAAGLLALVPFGLAQAGNIGEEVVAEDMMMIEDESGMIDEEAIEAEEMEVLESDADALEDEAGEESDEETDEEEVSEEDIEAESDEESDIDE